MVAMIAPPRLALGDLDAAIEARLVGVPLDSSAEWEMEKRHFDPIAVAKSAA